MSDTPPVANHKQREQTKETLHWEISNTYRKQINVRGGATVFSNFA